MYIRVRQKLENDIISNELTSAMDAEVVEELSRMLAGRTVVSGEEVRRMAIRASLKVLGLKLVDVGDDFINEVACSLIECPITLRSLHFSEEVKVGDATFYHLHTRKPTREDFEVAYREFEKSKSYLEGLSTMVEITDRFFADYEARGKFMRLYERDRYRYAVFYSVIDDVYEDIDVHTSLASSFNGEYIVVVPTESSVEPFLKFFKHRSEDVKKANLKIWVANTSEKSIDPFIGYPRDFKLLKGFKNPKAASIINSLWRVNVTELD